ncbi:MAG: pentapeptide repeat-containing protein [Nostocaceae cyanobacterium]|nr:pentapeptide repeat-containing protein [Nostocaceae cyanobacterium]
MKIQILATGIFLTILNLNPIAQAGNPENLRQLLTTKNCPQCDLSNAGLVMADLSGANLSGANLVGANLSRANLTGADLRGANLSGTGLFGANLNSAKLSGATLIGADLRNTYLFNAELTSANINGANLQGATGIPAQIAKPEDFYAWGVAAAQKGNQEQAIEYFDQAIAQKPDYAGAYLARGVARYQILDRQRALQDAQTAEKLFQEQSNTEGIQTAQIFILELQTPYTEAKVDRGKPKFMDFVGSLGSALLNFLPF